MQGPWAMINLSIYQIKDLRCKLAERQGFESKLQKIQQIMGV